MTLDYSNFQSALLLGEADFSFTKAFAKEFQGRITATEYGCGKSITDRYYEGDASTLAKSMERLMEFENVQHVMASVDARTLGDGDACTCERWNHQSKSFEPSSPFWEHVVALPPFDLLIFNFPHTDKFGKTPNLLHRLFSQLRICISEKRFATNVVVEMRLRDKFPPNRIRVDYKHEEAARENSFEEVGVYENDLRHWEQLGYEHRMTNRNATCRDMSCQVWRWRLKQGFEDGGINKLK